MNARDEIVNKTVQRLTEEAQTLADDAWCFSREEVLAIAAVYEVETASRPLGDIRAEIATKRAAYMRPQADPVSISDEPPTDSFPETVLNIDGRLSPSISY